MFSKFREVITADEFKFSTIGNDWYIDTNQFNTSVDVMIYRWEHVAGWRPIFTERHECATLGEAEAVHHALQAIISVFENMK